MAKPRLKVDPEAIDLMLTAIVLSRRNKLQHAGHYAFLALGRVVARSLPDEEGPTTPMNFSRRMSRLCQEKGFPEEWWDKISSIWNTIRYYLYRKVSYTPSYRSHRIKTFIDSVRNVLEQLSAVKFEEILGTMTYEDVQRLEEDFGDTLFPEANYGES
jgi:hypothetical protein